MDSSDRGPAVRLQRLDTASIHESNGHFSSAISPNPAGSASTPVYHRERSWNHERENSLVGEILAKQEDGQSKKSIEGYMARVKAKEAGDSADGFTTQYREATPDSDDAQRSKRDERHSSVQGPGIDDPFPEDPTAPVEDQEFTLRAILIGSLLGALINASNLYLGLKTGITFGAGVFGAMAGYGVMRILTSFLPTTNKSTTPFQGSKWRRFFKLGDYCGPKETMLMTSTATSAGALGGFFANCVPAFYQLNLLSDKVGDDTGRLITLGLVTCYFGMVFAIPLRKLYILTMKLPFPADSATAFLIRSLHISKEAAANKKKTISLLVAFACALTYKVVSQYLPGVLWNWHLFWWMYRPGGWNWIVAAESWGWWIQWSPAFIGFGVFIGVNGAASFLGGSVLAWGIIGPLTVSSGVAVGTELAPEVFPGYFDYFEIASTDAINAPPPRLWLLWPGVMILLCSAGAEVALEAGTIARATVAAFHPVTQNIKRLMGRDSSFDRQPNPDHVIYDPAPVSERVPFWMWGSILFASIVATCLVLGLQYHEAVGMTLLGLFLGFIFTFVSAETFGRVSINANIGSTADQLILAAIAKAQHKPPNSAAMSSLWGNTLGIAASQQACDILGNLKTAHLLGASPRVQFYGQIIGGGVSAFMSVILYIVFVDAFPCINNNKLASSCSFTMPPVQQALALTEALLAPALPISKSSGFTAIGLGLLSILIVVVKRFWIPERFKNWVPNFAVLGLGFIIPGVYTPAAIFLGCLLSALWRWQWPVSYAILAFPIAVGMVTGEGIGGVFTAILEIAGAGGSTHGSGFACPAKEWCG